MARIQGGRLHSIRRRLCGSAAFLPLAFAVGAPAALAQSVAGNVIIPDGRTATQLSVTGTTTDITTGTMAGGNAYNSFSQFTVGTGNAVNLQVPDQANYLINLVHNGSVVVDGTLNAYKNGQIGGNVVFSDPYGFMVGRGGVVNTGSLTVNTPTADFLDRVIDPSGTVDAALGARLVDGDVPLSPDGSIVISGRVNAADAVALKGDTVGVNGLARHQAAFDATVNTTGLVTGGGIVVRDGHISIVAAGSARISGTLRAGGTQTSGGSVSVSAGGDLKLTRSAEVEALHAVATGTAAAAYAPPSVDFSAGHDLLLAGHVAADGGDGLAGGTVHIDAGNDISLAGSAVVTAAGTGAASSGGSLVVMAGHDLAVANGFTASAAAGTTGDGGSVELSAHGKATFGSISVDLGAAGGKAGSLLIDPADLVIGVTGGPAGATYEGSWITDGGNVTLSADNSITIASGYEIDTRQSATYAGDVTLTAPNITIAAGASILADVSDESGGSTGGTVTLTAAQTATDSFGDAGSAAHFTSAIDVEGTIRGAVVTIDASADYTVNSLYAGAEAQIVLNGTIVGDSVSVLSHANAVSDFAIGSEAFGVMTAVDALNPLGLEGAYVGAGSSATLTVGANARISGGSVELSSTSSGKAADSSIGLEVAGGYLATSVIIGTVSTTAHTDVQSGAQITATDALKIGATTDTNLTVLSSVISGLPFLDSGSATAVGSVAYGKASVDASATVDSGAVIDGPAAVTLLARNDNSFGIAAKVYATGSGQAGGSLAISDVAADATARLGTDAGTAHLGDTDASPDRRVGDVTIEALSNTTNNKATASTTVGTGVIGTILTTATSIAAFTKGATPDIGGVTALIYNKLKASKADTVSSDENAKGAGSLSILLSSLSADASIAADGDGTAPTVESRGNVAVISDVADASVVSNAVSGVNSNAKNPSAGNTGTTFAIAVGVSVAELSHDSTALIAPDSTVIADAVGLSATTELPSPFQIDNWGSFSSVLSGVAQGLEADPSVLTSGAKATTESNGWGLAGSFDYFSVDENTIAWIGHGATVTATAAAPVSSWQAAVLADLDTAVLDHGDPVTVAFADQVSVVARSSIDTIDIIGNWGLTGVGGQGSAATSVGGSGGALLYSADTVAGIGDAASVTSGNGLEVTANASDDLFGISPSNGSGASIALSGLVVVVEIDNTTHASISNTADVTALATSVLAEQDLGIYSVTGEFVSSSGASLGISVAVLDIATDTAAFVGDNIGEVGTDIDPLTVASAAGGAVHTDALDVAATTDGTVAAIAVAATKASNDKASHPPPGTSSKALELLQGSQATSATPVTPTFSLTISGSGAVVDNELDTSAYVDGVTLAADLATSGASATVLAKNDALVIAASGAAALSLGGQSSTGSVAIAGAVAVGVSDNTTLAYIRDATLTGIDDVTVHALAGGLTSIVGLGLAVATTDNPEKPSATAAGSVSIALIEDSVQAYVEDSSLASSAADAVGAVGAVDVEAYRSTVVGIGAGSFSYGGQGGFGIALTYTTIEDNADGYAADAHISNTDVTNYDTVSVVADAPSRIYSGAATVDVLVANGLAGAVIVNDIGGTVYAAINATASGTELDAGGDVTVRAGTADNADLDALMADAAASDAAPDFPDTDASGGAVIAPGAAVVSVAGLIAVGGNNVGAGIIDNSLHQAHTAAISGLAVDAGGTVTVAADDDTSILAVGVGVAVGGGELSLEAASVTDYVGSTLSATVSGASVDAADLDILASDGATIRGTAGVFANGGATSLGFTVAVDQIAMGLTAALDSSTVITDGSLDVLAHSTATILTISVGVAASGNAGIAGSAATSTIADAVSAAIGGGSDVTAQNNVYVGAVDAETIQVVAGAAGIGLAAGGAGLSVVVNQLGGDTSATIDGSTVDANAAGPAVTVLDGDLVHAVDASAANEPGLGTPDYTQKTRDVGGVAVIASSTQTVAGVAVTLGFSLGGPGAAIVPIVTIAGGSTTAAITGSDVDTRLAEASAIDVMAASHTFSGNFAVGGAGGEAAGAGAAVGTTMDRTTIAKVSGGALGSSDPDHDYLTDVAVRAIASQATSDISVGFAAGVAAGTASGVVTIFDADTEAYVEDAAVAAVAAEVGAESSNGWFAAAGSGAFGGTGVAGAFIVGVSRNTTIARIGDGSAATTLVLAGDLTVTADSDNAFTSDAIGAAGAGGSAIAGMAVVTQVSNDTEALVDGASVAVAADALSADRTDGEHNALPAGVLVAATETVDATPLTAGGAAAETGAGFGAAANVVMLSSKLVAEAEDSTITAPGLLQVSATADRTVSADTVTVGAGLSAGIGAAVGVILIGDAVPADALAELNHGGSGTLAAMNNVSVSGNNYLLSSAGLAAWRAAAASALGVATPTDTQVQAYALGQYLTLLSNGSVDRNGDFTLNAGEAATFFAAFADAPAQTAALWDLVGAKLTTGEVSDLHALVTYGSIDRNGVFTVNAAGIAAFHAAAAAALGIANPTDAQVQQYAVGRYQALTQKVSTAAGSDFTALITAAASDEYAALTGDNRAAVVLATGELPYYAAKALSPADYAEYQALLDDNTALDGSFSPKDGTLAQYSDEAEAALGLSSAPTDAQITAYLQERYAGFVTDIRQAADSDYQALLAAGTVTGGHLALTAAGIDSLAPTVLSASDDALYSGLLAHGSVAGGSFTLADLDAELPDDSATYRQAAASALQIATPTDAQVASYWSGRYDTLVRSIETNANGEYRVLAANLRTQDQNFSVTTAASGAADGVFADVTGGVTTVGILTVDATDAVSASNITTGVGLGGGVGIGAAVGYTQSNAAVAASVSGGEVTAGMVTVNALVTDGSHGSAADTEARAGGGGLGAAVGAAVAVSTATNAVSATLGGIIDAPDGATGTSLVAMATDASSLTADAYGAAASDALAAGVSVAEAEKSSTVGTAVADDSSLMGFDLLGLSSQGSGSVEAMAVAGAGGLIAAGAGAAAIATDDEDVTAIVGSGSIISAGAVMVDAEATPALAADAVGVAVAGIGAVGASVALATADVTVTAAVDDDVTIAGGGLVITASALLPTGNDGDTAKAEANAGAGGIGLFGIDATDAEATDTSTVTASAGKRLGLPDGDVVISAVNDNKQDASSTGIAAGFVAAGAVLTTAASGGTTSAWLDDAAASDAGRAGGLFISAVGASENDANSTAGSGGVFAGAASLATTSDDATTTAELRGGTAGYTLATGALTVQAQHASTYYGDADSYQASAIGASGADAENHVSSTVTASVAPGLIVNATDNVSLLANNYVTENGGGARAGSGGIAAGAAALSNSSIDNTTTVNVGDGSVISLNGDPSTTTAKIDIEAFNRLEGGASTTLDAGGLFAGGGGDSDLSATITDAVNIGTGAVLFSAGSIQIGTATITVASNSADADLYGLVTGAGASTDTDLEVTQSVDIGTDTRVEGFGTVTVTAGQSGNGYFASYVDATATTEVYNYAVIPISADYSGSATAHNYTSLAVGDGSQILAGSDITVGAYKGTVSADGSGTNHNPYLALFNTTTHDDYSDPKGTADVTLNGTIYAGINDQQTITIGLDGSVTLTPQPYPWTFTAVASGEVGAEFVSYDSKKLNYSVGNSYNPYADIVSALVALTGLDTDTVRSDLATKTDMTAGLDLSDDAARQVDTFVKQAASVPDTNVDNVAVGDIQVSGGNVTIHADSLSGSAAVTAKGAPKIDIENNGTGYVLLSKLLVATNDGGHINFTGGASDASDPALSLAQDTSPGKPEIVVDSNYPGIVDELGNVTIPTITPDIYFLGDVSNLAGAVSIKNKIGNVTILAQNFYAATIDMDIPNGNLSVNEGAGSVYDTNNAVTAQWAGTEFKPTDVGVAVEAVATYVETAAYFGRDGSYNPVGNGGFDDDPNGDAHFTSIVLNPYGKPSDVWFRIYGDDLPAGSQTGRTEYWGRGYYRWYTWNGDGDSTGPFGYLRFDVIQRQALSYAASTAASPPAQAPVIAGGSIIISASVININGTIESGHSNNWSVNIGADAEAIIEKYENDADLKAANAGRFIALPTTTTGGALDTPIGAYYDVTNDQITLQNVVQGAGGQVYLNGGIVSTSTTGTAQGNIVVNGGFAAVDIENTTGTRLVTNTINTGVATSSVVEIVDQFKQVDIGGGKTAPTKTWYVYDVTQANPVSVYTQADGTGNADYKQATLVSTGTDQTQSYDPASNLLYEWVDTATATRAAPTSLDNLSLWAWTYPNAADPTNPYTTTRSVVQDDPNNPQSTNFKETVTGSVVFTPYSQNQDHDYGSDFHGVWYENVATSATITLTNTVKASNTIGITFQGSANGTVAINSNATVEVANSITNHNGSTTITTTGADSAILAGASGLVTGRSVTLSGEGGIGATGAPVAVEVFDGTLTARSVDRDIDVSANGPLTVSSIKVAPAVTGDAPLGNVFLSAGGDINSASAYDLTHPVIVGKSIEIDSTGGAIGAVSGVDGHGQPVLSDINPIVIEANGTVLDDGSVDGGILNSTSSTGTYIVQSTGDLRIGFAGSNGPVFLAAAGSDGNTANIISGAEETGLTLQQSEALRAVWQTLNLLGTATSDGTVGVDGAANTDVFDGSAAVHGYEALVDRAYRDYWQLRSFAFTDGHTYVISDAGAVALKAQIAAENGVSASAVTDAEVEAEATRRFGIAEYVLGLSNALPDGVTGYVAAPVNAGLTSALASYDSSFSYALADDTDLYGSLTSGSRWTISQLTYTIDRSANPASNTPPPTISELPLNVGGRDVMLYAPHGSIGSLGAPKTFSFTSAVGSPGTELEFAL